VTRRIVCVGDVMLDVLARLPGPLATGSDTPAPVTYQPGGSAANTAAWLVAAGARALFVGRVGDDVSGRQAVADLVRAGVETEVGVDPERPTGTCIVLVDGHGERTMVPSTGANAGLGDQPLPSTLFDPPTAHLHLSGYAMLTAGARRGALRARDLAVAAGCPVSVDAGSSAPLRVVGPDTFLDWLPVPCLILANADEAAVLTGRDGSDAANARALGARLGEAIVKRGRHGALWSDGRELVEVEAEAATVVDTTGAGDAFAAGVLAARLGGADVQATLAAGCRLAARAISRLGARPDAAERR
jgi:sugar/nucleoside kinase (ribokinase family)